MSEGSDNALFGRMVCRDEKVLEVFMSRSWFIIDFFFFFLTRASVCSGNIFLIPGKGCLDSWKEELQQFVILYYCSIVFVHFPPSVCMEEENPSFVSVSIHEGGAPRLAPCVIVADRKGVIRSINDGACRLFGYPKEDLLGNSIKILMPASIANQHDAILARYFDKKMFKGTGTRTVVGVRKNGDAIHIQLFFSYIHSEVADSEPLVCALISELQEHSMQVECSGEGVILRCRGNVRDTCGWDPEDLIGRNINDTLCPTALSASHARFMQQYADARQQLTLKLSSVLSSFSSYLSSSSSSSSSERPFDGNFSLDDADLSIVAPLPSQRDVLKKSGRDTNLLDRSLLSSSSDLSVVSQCSRVIGHVRNREMLHKAGHVIPVSLEILELSRNPMILQGHFIEIEHTMEAMITVNQDMRIVAVGSGCTILFGYEEQELLGMPITKLSPGISLKNEGKRFVIIHHKDGSHFFVSVDVQRIMLNGDECYRGIIHRSQPNKAKKQRSAVTYDDDQHLDVSNVLDWYEVDNKKVLGEGFFGRVRVATHRLTGVFVAIKTLKRKQFEDEGMPYPPRELELLSKLRHPNIVRFFHSICTEDACYIISEVVNGGELFDYAAQRDHLSEVECRGFMRQIVSAVDYMHRCGICHRDLKLENILLDAAGNVKVIDFGLGNFFTSSCSLSTFCGSPDYAPPEQWLNQPYVGPEIDVWSLGVIVFIMTTGFIPFNSSAHIIEMRYHWPSDREFSEELRDLVARIFCTRKARCSLEDIINHAWMNDGGRMRPIARVPIERPSLSSSQGMNEKILQHMEHDLGLPRQDVKRSVQQGQHNQFSTTYYLLEYQQEERLETHRLSDVVSSNISNSADSSLSPKRGSLESPNMKSQKQCTLF